MSDRICPECGSDIYFASHFSPMLEDRNRHRRKVREQAITIAELQLKVEELQYERATRSRKIEKQRRVIVRLEDRLRSVGLRPHEDKKLGESDPVSRTPEISYEPPVGEMFDYPHITGARQMRKRVRKS